MGRYAAICGNLYMVRALCEKGANPLAETQVRDQQRARACMAGNDERLSLHLQHLSHLLPS